MSILNIINNGLSTLWSGFNYAKRHPLQALVSLLSLQTLVQEADGDKVMYDTCLIAYSDSGLINYSRPYYTRAEKLFCLDKAFPETGGGKEYFDACVDAHSPYNSKPDQPDQPEPDKPEEASANHAEKMVAYIKAKRAYDACSKAKWDTETETKAENVGCLNRAFPETGGGKECFDACLRAYSVKVQNNINPPPPTRAERIGCYNKAFSSDTHSPDELIVIA